MMACDAIHGCSVLALAAAYYDLAIAYLLLVAATFAFIAAKLLALLALPLPCCCRRRSPASAALLLDAAAARTASIHASLPFDSFCTASAPARRFEVRILDDDRGAGATAPAPILSLPGPSPADESFPDGKGKGILLRPRPQLLLRGSCRRRRRHPPPLSPLLSQAGQLSNIDGLDESASLWNDVEKHACDGDLAYTVRKLKRALEEERAARATLCLDLEKERSAAASAADEAMAMILRLQEEKAAIQMEGRQFRRMVEEKSAYDEEEMEVLKEIIVRREREKHVLEKEVEACRWMALSSGRLEQSPGASLDSCADGPVPDGEKEKEDNKNKNEQRAMSELLLYGNANPGRGIHNHHHLEQADFCDVSTLEFQEKNMVTTDINSSPLQNQEVAEHVRDSKIELRVGIDDLYGEHNRDSDPRGCSSSQFDFESNVLDVHVVDDELIMGAGTSGKGDLSQTGCSSGISKKGNSSLESSGLSDNVPPKDLPSSNLAGVDQNIRRSCTDIIKRSSVMDRLCNKTSLFNLRRMSTSAVESERFKLETEVELLRKRLKKIQEGREKLNIPVERREKESFQLQLLEEISCQLQQIRIMNEPGKSVRQASLPPPSSKVKSKRRRCRSVPWELSESM